MSDKFSNWLKEELEKRKWSGNDLAKESNLSQPVISRVLNGKRKPTPDFCAEVAKVFGEPPEKVLRLAGIIPPLPTSENDQIIAEIIEVLRSMPIKQRQEVLRYVQYLYRTGKDRQ